MKNTIRSVVENKKDLLFVAGHVLMGIVAAIFPLIVPLFITLVVLLYIFRYSWGEKAKLNTIIFISYLTGLEILYRSSGVTFLPFELSKYVQVCFILANLIITRKWFKSNIGVFIIVLWLPSLIVFPPDEYKYVVFNSGGIFALALLISFTAYQKITFSDFTKILKAFIFAAVSFGTYITIKTPELSELEFGLGASSTAAGGFGSNQVATILGAAICFGVIMVDQKVYIFNRVMTLGLLLYFGLRALLTFSRGGIIGLVISVIISFLVYKKLQQSNLVKLIIFFSAAVVIFLAVNVFTGGQLLLRYQGETEATVSGDREKDANVLLSGRQTLGQVDLAIWLDNFLLGVGPGHTQFIRYKYGVYDDAPPHTEATRLLSENGIFGLAINLILIFWPVYVLSKTPDKNIKFLKCMLFILAYTTTFHSAMRTGISPLFYGLASMNIYLPYTGKRSVKQFSLQN